jgi:serine/threonine protein kinase
MPSDCPSHHDLVAFHLGTLPESQLDGVAEHLEKCPACEAALARLDTSVDPVVAVLRKPIRADALSSAPTVLPPASPGHEEEADFTVAEDRATLQGYEVLGLLGSGVMGTVYKVRQRRLNRLAALKQFHSGTAQELMGARVEAEALTHLQHPNIVQTYEVLELQGALYLALELVEGGPLSKVLGKPQPVRKTAELVELLARAVHYAHAQGVVHGNLKPSNVLLHMAAWPEGAATLGKNAIPKICDFGVSRRLAAPPGAVRPGGDVGALAYLSPEQVIGQVEQLGPATDVYSLGILLYEMLTGRVPLQGPTTDDTLVLVRTADPVPLRRFQPQIPRELETICLKCLEKDPRRRYHGAAELADDLRRFLDGQPILVRPTRAWQRTWKSARRRPVVTALAAAFVLTTVLGLILAAITWW